MLDRLRTPFFFIFLVAFGLVVLLEIGATAVVPEGMAISYLALIDVIMFGTAALMGMSVLFSKRLHARAQGIITLVGAIVLILIAIVLLFIAIAQLIVMVTLLLAFPFGTIAYLIIWGDFPRGDASVVLSLIMFLKVVGLACLVIAQQRFLQNKGLVAMAITSLLGNVVAVFLHGLVPGILVSITDDIAGIVFAIVAIIWAIILLIGSIPAIVRALQQTAQRA